MNQLNLFDFETNLLNSFEPAVCWSSTDPNRTIYLHGYVINRRGIIKNTKTGKILRGRTGETKVFKSGQRYISVRFVVHKKMYDLLLHRVVACTFIKCIDRETYTIVNHIDHNKKNNHYANLEWCSPSENMEAWADQHFNLSDENQLKLL